MAAVLGIVRLPQQPLVAGADASPEQSKASLIHLSTDQTAFAAGFIYSSPNRRRLCDAKTHPTAGLPETMRAVHIRLVGSNGGPEALEPVELPLPWSELGDNHVLIKVAAAGVNRPDVLQRQGRYPPPAGHSPLPGLEVSGVVVAAGKGVLLEGR